MKSSSNATPRSIAVSLCLLVLGLSGLIAVPSLAEPTSPPTHDSQRLVVTSQGIAPQFEKLIREQAAKTGVVLELRRSGGSGSEAFLSAAESGAVDLLITAHSGDFEPLARKGLLAKLPKTAFASVASRFRDPDSQWVGVAGDLRVLAYNPDRIEAEKLPRALSGLALPDFDTLLGWSFASSDFRAHLNALRRRWGREKTRQWLQAVDAGTPGLFNDEAALLKGLGKGKVHLAMVSFSQIAQHRRLTAGTNQTLPVLVHSFPNHNDAGNLLMMTTVALVRGSQKTEQAVKLIQSLTGSQAQTELVESLGLYPASAETLKTAPIELRDAPITDFNADWTSDTPQVMDLLRHAGVE